MQVATAREGVLGHLGVGRALLATMTQLDRAMLFVITLVLTVASVLLREPIASAVGVKHFTWGAALGIPTGCLYLQVSLLRGALQGVGDYKGVGLSLIGEQAVRLVTGAAVRGRVRASPARISARCISYIAMSAYCWVQLRKYAASYAPPDGEAAPAATGPAISLWRHVERAWAPIAGLAVIAVLQNIDIIAAKHRFPTHTATSYAAVAVAAKVLIWVAIGAGFYLVPEVSRRRSEGEDTRPVLFRALGIIACARSPAC